MKYTENPIYIWSGLILLTSLFCLVLIWSLVPVNGMTLPRILEQVLNVTFHTSALCVSLACGILAVGAIALTLFIPLPETNSPCLSEGLQNEPK